MRSKLVEIIFECRRKAELVNGCEENMEVEKGGTSEDGGTGLQLRKCKKMSRRKSPIFKKKCIAISSVSSQPSIHFLLKQTTIPAINTNKKSNRLSNLFPGAALLQHLLTLLHQQQHKLILADDPIAVLIHLLEDLLDDLLRIPCIVQEECDLLVGDRTGVVDIEVGEGLLEVALCYHVFGLEAGHYELG